jgi:hypothetical protein
VGCIIGIVSSSLVVVPIDYKAVFVYDPINRELVTSTEYISTGGYHVLLIIIFAGVYHLRKYFKNNMSSNTL